MNHILDIFILCDTPNLHDSHVDTISFYSRSAPEPKSTFMCALVFQHGEFYKIFSHMESISVQGKIRIHARSQIYSVTSRAYRVKHCGGRLYLVRLTGSRFRVPTEFVSVTNCISAVFSNSFNSVPCISAAPKEFVSILQLYYNPMCNLGPLIETTLQ